MKPNRLFHFVFTCFLEPKKDPFFGTNPCSFETDFSISELQELSVRDQRAQRKQLPILFHSTNCLLTDLKLPFWRSGSCKALYDLAVRPLWAHDRASENSAQHFISLNWWVHCRRCHGKNLKAFPNVWTFTIFVNIKAGGTSWPWSSEPVAAVGRCRGAPRRINFPKFWKKIKKTFVKVWSKNVFSKFGKMMRSEPFRKSLAQRCFSKFGPIFKGLIRRRIFLNSFSLKVI